MAHCLNITEYENNYSHFKKLSTGMITRSTENFQVVMKPMLEFLEPMLVMSVVRLVHLKTAFISRTLSVVGAHLVRV